uniref:C-type lectin domain-containing protein n=1 Tax=Hucho hucho TaxID=62062 RepID=A0A4W5R1J9_9TELE
MANYVNKQVIELYEVTEENRNRATRSVKSETQLSAGSNEEGNQLETCYNTTGLAQDRDQPDTSSIIDLYRERDQLQKERDQCQKNMNQLKRERGQSLWGRDQSDTASGIIDLCTDRDQLQKERDQCRKNMKQLERERGQLLRVRDQSDSSRGIINLCTDRDQLQKERDQCRKNMNQLEKERGQLLRERDQSENTEDQLQERYNAVTKDRDMLRNRISVLTNEKRLSERGKNICRKIRKTCPEGWRLCGSSCYFLSTEMKTWEESRLDCLMRGAYLVIINSKEEQEFLYGLIKGAWIGLTDIVTEGTWKWVDGTPPRYWGSGEPNGGGVENCVVVTYRSSGQGDLSDYQCSSPEYWICEKGSL